MELSGERLRGRVALVTGAAGGIGGATAARLAAEGASVACADRQEQGAGAAADAVGGLALRCDVAAEADVEAAVAATLERFGRLDALVACAGIGGAYGPLTEIDAGHWDETFAVLARGVVLGMKHAARAMLAAGRGGAIVNVASVAGLAGGCAPIAYSAAKAAVIAMTRSAAVELAPQRIRVNAVCPGVVMTGMVHRGRPERAAEVERVVSGFQPWPDLGRPEDVAAAIAWLCSDDSAFVTGEALVADGGVLAGGPRYTRELFGAPEQPGISRGRRG